MRIACDLVGWKFGQTIGLQWPEQLMKIIMIIMTVILIFSEKKSFGLYPSLFANEQELSESSSTATHSPYTILIFSTHRP